jgi:hypothetical protein
MRARARGARRTLATLALLAGATAIACQRDEPTAHDRILATLAAAEQAAEAGDAAALKSGISDAYRDAAGRDKQAVGAIVGLHLLQQRSVHLLTRVVSVAVEPPGEARAEVLVAMAASPIDGPELLAGVRADLYRFDLSLREENGNWRVVSAAWRPAVLDDFR